LQHLQRVLSCREDFIWQANLNFFANPRGWLPSFSEQAIDDSDHAYAGWAYRGAGLAFSLLGYWLLLAESKKSKERVEMHTSIRIFIALSALTFAFGLTVNIVALLFAARSQAVVTAFSPDSTTARFVSWGADDEKQTISFRVLIENLDPGRYVPRQEKDNYRLVVGIRPVAAVANDSGSYSQVFGDYPFDSLPEQVAPVTAQIKAMLDTGCVSYVLFRVRASRLPTQPKPPFVPSDYGSDIKILNTATDGMRCP
jgi:hypothetical protein